MNKDKVYLKGYVIGRAVDTLGYNGLMVQLENLDVVEIDKNLVHRDINEPQKDTVPQGIADYIKYAKENDWDLQDAMNLIVDEEDGSFSDWFYKGKNMELFARAWLDGYEVGEEKRYRVSLKNGQPLLKAILGKALYFSQDIAIESYKVTRKELEEAGFGWVLDCPGVEVEEVTE